MSLVPYYEHAGITIYHGDCLEVLSSIPTGSVDLTVTSPPYNCRKDYGTASDERRWSDYYSDLKLRLEQIYRMTRDGGTIAIVVPGVVRWQSNHAHADTWRDFDRSYAYRKDGEMTSGKGRIEPLGFALMDMMREQDSHLREPIIWVKGDDAINGKYQMGCDSDPYCRPAHEMILLGSKGKWFHRGGTGRRGPEALPWLDECKDVWFLPPGRDRTHPATFPDDIPLRLCRLFIHAPDALICDPYMGSGTSLLVAKGLKLKAIGIEIEEKYCEIAAKRLAQEVFDFA